MGGPGGVRVDRDRKRKLDALFRGLPHWLPGDVKGKKKPKASTRDGTQGVTLPHLNAVVCMDYVDSTCYVDIQQWGGTKMVGVQPARLHPSLGKWAPYWRGGGGEMSRSMARRLQQDLQAIERAFDPMAEAFGESDEEDAPAGVFVETETI